MFSRPPTLFAKILFRINPLLIESTMTSASNSNSSLASEVHIDTLKRVVKDTDAFDHHIALITALQQTDDLRALRAARLAFADSHPLPESVWHQWIEDERQLAIDGEDQHQLLRLMNRAVHDCPTPSLCLVQLNITISLVKASHIHADISDTFQEALWLGAAAHFTRGDLLWQTITEAGHHPSSLPTFPPLSSGTSDETDGYRVFESRLETLAEDAPSDDIVSLYLSYATFAAEIHYLSAISVYERCIQRFPSNHLTWVHYLKFCALQGDDDRSFFVSNRATRACPTLLSAWVRLVASIAHVTPRFVSNRANALVDVINAARPHVLQSSALKDAANLTKIVWTVFRFIGLPSTSYDAVCATLEFNVQDSVEWASACCHAAAIELGSGHVDEAVQLFERVVAVRGYEPRWWLVYTSCLQPVRPMDTSLLFERALNSVAKGFSSDAIEDAWLVYEAHASYSDPVQRTLLAIETANDKRQGVGGTIFNQRPTDSDEKQRKRGRSIRGAAKRLRSDIGLLEKESVDVNEASPEAVKDMEVELAKHSDIVGDSGTGIKTINKRHAEQGNDEVKRVSDSGKGKSGKRGNQAGEDGVEPRTIYLNNLPFRATESDIREAYQFAGKIDEIRLPRRSDGASKGFAYIEFERDESVAKALENRTVLGRTVWVRRSQPRPRLRKTSGPSGGLPIGRTRRHKRVNVDLVSERKNDNSVEASTNADVDMESDEAGTVGTNDSEKPKTQADFRAMFLGKKN